MPITYKTSQEFANKKVILFAVPGAFTPGCSVRHLPGYIENLTDIKGKGVDVVAVIATNDAFVMSAWGKVNGIKDEILFMNDPDAKFSKSIGWDMGVSPNRTARYAMVIDNGVVKYAEKEPGRDVTVSLTFFSVIIVELVIRVARTDKFDAGLWRACCNCKALIEITATA